ncbi:sulfurtransferase TusA family protein [Thiomicrospira cyclica]|jgi:tRNA 2-thiouridine synthesizing protein A|uniref:SirA-like domain-containing protein n=1 Tax=Thiomicrospira cyclica (strain DSM 14477 / JCM 11371 / ALM1) TaxID=717773 RepID=F6D9W0_THICA|nr:sulfurtransferase TusA family protein [Thiomicrospira cyclica]AEG30997.1 SirA-like domain-containing protein [Thiomicrospira cyclica ALM1]
MQKVNLIGLKCPMPLIRFKKTLAEFPCEASFEVFVDDPGALSDFPAFCRKFKYECHVLSEEPHITLQINRS